MIRALVVGKQNKKLIEFENELIARIKKLYNQFEIIEFKQSNSKQETKDIIEFLEKQNKDQVNIFLEIKGKAATLATLDQLINETKSSKQVNFVIGGADGFDKYEIENKKISFSNLTLNHHMCRLFLIEQIYRILSIQNNLPYHR